MIRQTTLVLFLLSGPALALDTSAGAVDIVPVATGLNEPWSIGFLPDGSFLVTERDGRLLRFLPSGEAPQVISGVPDVFAEGQGGLFDVVVPRDFDQSGEVILSYALPSEDGGGTAIALARLDGQSLSDVRVIWKMAGPVAG